MLPGLQQAVVCSLVHPRIRFVDLNTGEVEGQLDVEGISSDSGVPTIMMAAHHRGAAV